MAGRFLTVGTGKQGPGVMYSSIKTACAAAVAGDEVVVYPGTYSEVNPITMVAGTVLNCQRGVTITGTVAAQHVIVAASSCYIYGPYITGNCDATHACVHLPNGTTGCVLRQVRIGSAGYGVWDESGQSTNLMDTISQAVGTTGNLLHITNGSDTYCRGLFMFTGATTTTVAFITGATASLTLQTCNIHATVTNGIYADDGALVDGSSVFIDAATYALRLGNSGVAPTIELVGAYLEASGTYDIYCQHATGKVRFSGKMDVNKVSTGGSTQLILQTVTEGDVGYEGNISYGPQYVGNIYRPSRTNMGEGRSRTVDMYVFRNTNLEAGVWSDITANMKDTQAGTDNLFPGTGTDNCCYFGASQSTPKGIKVVLTAAMVLGVGSYIEFSWWNGASWIVFNKMAVDSTGTISYANAIWLRVANEDIQFDTASYANVAKALNGTTAYWIRARITVAALTTVPTAQYCRIHGSQTRISETGVLNRFGYASINRIISKPEPKSWTTKAPASSNVAISANITYAGTLNQYNDNVSDGTVFTVPVPEGLDTSKPITFRTLFTPTANVAAGNVELELLVVRVVTGSTIGALTEYSYTQITGVLINSANVTYANTITFYAPDVVPGDYLVIGHFRDATGGNPHDTLGSNIVNLDRELSGYYYR